MAKHFDKLKRLPVNKTVVFWTPIEGEDVMVRTGTIAEGSCLFHAALHSYSKDYVSMDRRGRMEFVHRLRASLAGKVDREIWEDMGGGLIAKIPFQENVNNILVNFYRFLNNDSEARGSSTRRVIKKLVGENESELELYKLVKELIPIDTGFEQKILPNAYKKTEDSKISDCCVKIIDETILFLNNREEIKSISNKKAKYIRDITIKFIKEVLEEAEVSAFKNYVSGLRNVSVNVDTYTIGLISDRFNRDIYFIDGRNRMPYNNTSTTENLKGRKSMILLWINENHYEIVGRLLPGNRIQREFSHDDPIIKKLYTFLIKPEEIHEKFPDLVPYIPQEYRDKLPSHIQFPYSDEEDCNKKSHSPSLSSESDLYYDSESYNNSDSLSQCSSNLQYSSD